MHRSSATRAKVSTRADLDDKQQAQYRPRDTPMGPTDQAVGRSPHATLLVSTGVSGDGRGNGIGLFQQLRDWR